MALSLKWSTGESGTQCPAVAQWSRGLSPHLRGDREWAPGKVGGTFLLKRSERLGAGPGQQGQQGWPLLGGGNGGAERQARRVAAGRGGSTRAQPRAHPPSTRPPRSTCAPRARRPPVPRDGSWGRGRSPPGLRKPWLLCVLPHRYHVSEQRKTRFLRLESRLGSRTHSHRRSPGLPQSAPKGGPSVPGPVYAFSAACFQDAFRGQLPTTSSPLP